MKIKILFDEKIVVNEGDSIAIRFNDEEVFFGHIFTIKVIDGIIIEIIAYDSIRYLLARDTYIYNNKMASQVIKMICTDFSIEIGDIENTKYIIPYRIEENQSILDIIYIALDISKKFNNKNYILFDDFGKISLKSYENLKLPILIDYKNGTISYTHSRSIDKNVFNSVKVSVKNRKNKIISLYLEEDAENKKNWGTLRKFERLPNNFNAMQAKNYAKNVLNMHNKIDETIEITFLADSQMRAGNILDVHMGDVAKAMIIKECTQKIKNNENIMKVLLSIV